MNIIYYHTLREVDRNKKYCIVLHCIVSVVNAPRALVGINTYLTKDKVRVQ